MRRTALMISLLAAMLGATKGAAEDQGNAFGLVYQGAITVNAPDAVNIHPVSYKLKGLDIAANVYTPPNYDPAQHYPAVAVAHPNGGVKDCLLYTSPSPRD